jgi:hypothetical protein
MARPDDDRYRLSKPAGAWRPATRCGQDGLSKDGKFVRTAVAITGINGGQRLRRRELWAFCVERERRWPVRGTVAGRSASSRQGRLATRGEEVDERHDDGVRVVEMLAYRGVKLVEFALVR